MSEETPRVHRKRSRSHSIERRAATDDDPVNRMRHTMRSLTDALIKRDVRSISFEGCYQAVYDAVSKRDGGDDWLKELEASVQRLIATFHKSREEYNNALSMARGVWMYADVTVRPQRGLGGTMEAVFETAWTTWHSDRAFRSRLLWAPVRAVRLKLAVVAKVCAILEEIQLRPGGSLFHNTAEHFNNIVNDSAFIQQQPFPSGMRTHGVQDDKDELL